MVTTIQVDEKTLLILKKLKQELQTGTYAEAIERLAMQRTKKESHGGSLKKYLKRGETLKDILKELQDERRKSDRF